MIEDLPTLMLPKNTILYLMSHMLVLSKLLIIDMWEADHPKYLFYLFIYHYSRGSIFHAISLFSQLLTKSTNYHIALNEDL